MNRYIGPRPTFPFRILLKGRDHRTPTVYPFDQERCYYFFSARYAIMAGMRALGIGPNDGVLLPSYNCGTEIEPFLRYGVKPTFYKVNKELLTDIDDLLSKITEGIKAIFVTHFLGFPQPMDEIRKICIQKNLYLIEDCAHAFLSSDGKNFLGSFGDIAVFSIRKTLPIPEGGLLLINKKNTDQKYNCKKPSLFSTYYYVAELLRYRTDQRENLITENIEKYSYHILYNILSSVRFLLRGYRKLFNRKALYLIRPDSPPFIEDVCSWEISKVSRNVINETDFEKVKQIRRRNFEYLLYHLVDRKNGPELIYRELPPGVCPLFFPVLIENDAKRDRLYNSLRRKGIATHPWWQDFHKKVPWNDFPDAVYLKERLFGLPIHQDLSFGHLDRVIEEFEKAYQSI